MTPLPTTAKELSEYLQTDLFNLRNQLTAANGQINFDRETDQLDADQLRIWLPRYLVGRGQIKDLDKRQRVEVLLGQLNANETQAQPIEEIDPEKPNQDLPTNEKPIERARQTQPTNQVKLPKWVRLILSLLPILPLPTLGIAASYGVYHFASHFAPNWIAVFEAVGFELVYIGLSTLTDVPDKLKRRVRLVSFGAVGVSVVYNSISALLVLNPNLFDSLGIGWQIAVSIAHGLPIALLGYFVADLISTIKNQRK